VLLPSHQLSFAFRPVHRHVEGRPGIATAETHIPPLEARGSPGPAPVTGAYSVETTALRGLMMVYRGVQRSYNSRAEIEIVVTDPRRIRKLARSCETSVNAIATRVNSVRHAGPQACSAESWPELHRAFH
jgi:hypothetical protein